MPTELAPLGYEGIEDLRDRRVAAALAAHQAAVGNPETPRGLGQSPYERAINEIGRDLEEGSLDAFVQVAGEVSKLSPRVFRCAYWDRHSALAKGQVVGAGSELDRMGLLGKTIFVKATETPTARQAVAQPKRSIARQALRASFDENIPPHIRNCELIRTVEGWCTANRMNRSTLSRDTILRAAGRRR